MNLRGFAAILRVVAVTAAGVFVGPLGCGASVPTPPLGAHGPGDASWVVPFPPPPARVEILRDAALDGSKVWVDGQWVWETNRWVWRPGSFQLPQPGAVYAPPETVRLADGTLIHRPGVWRMAP